MQEASMRLPDSKTTVTTSDSDGPIISDNVIRIQLRKPKHRKWELRTHNRNTCTVFPIIQLFDCDGNILVETNDDNISIKSADLESRIGSDRKWSSIRRPENQKRFRIPIRKNNSIAGDKIYTRYFKRGNRNNLKRLTFAKSNEYKELDSPVSISDQTNNRIANTLIIPPHKQKAVESSASNNSSTFNSLNNSENEKSSVKSSDNESNAPNFSLVTSNAGTLMIIDDKQKSPLLRRRRCYDYDKNDDNVNHVKQWIDDCVDSDDDKRNDFSKPIGLQNSTFQYRSPCSKDSPILQKQNFVLSKSISFCNPNVKSVKSKFPRRSYTDLLPRIKQRQPQYKDVLSRKVSFLDTYLRSLPTFKSKEIPSWCNNFDENVKMRAKSSPPANKKWRQGIFINDDSKDKDSDIFKVVSDDAALHAFRKRLRTYRRVASCTDYWSWKRTSNANQVRRRSEGDISSSSESPDEADRVLCRLHRRILRNRQKERRITYAERRPPVGACGPCGPRASGGATASSLARLVRQLRALRPPRDHGQRECGVREHDHSQDMGANVSRQSGKGLNGRRAQSSGDLCNGDSSKSQTGSSVSGSVHGEAMGWNRSLPNHLDGRRNPREYEDLRPRENNNYRQAIEYGRHSRCEKRDSRYRKRGDLDPVWKLQDPGCDQGYGSERSPEEEFPPSLPAEDDENYEDYESQLRRMYPFITEDNTFTVVVEKDCRGLGLSVTGGVGALGGPGTGVGQGTGLVRIRRLYPPQPAWSTGRLAPGDLLLAANGMPLAGLTSYEALEVLRMTPPVVELLVCRPGAWVGGNGDRATPPGERPPPPAPPVRSTHTAPPTDPLNCHPAHARLVHTSSGTSSEDGYGVVIRPHSSFSNVDAGRSNHCGSFSSSSRPTKPEPIPRTSLRLPGIEQAPPPVFDIQYDGEFDIVMTKVNGSLGFTLRKEDHSALGHYVRALVREPALSDGRIRPGDRIVAVNDISMSNLSHSEAVGFLRQCEDEVRLRLYRDNAATPLSAMSPTESEAVLPFKPKRQFRQEAVNMLCDLAARKVTPNKGDGLFVPCLSPRKFRKVTADSTALSQDSAQQNSIHNPESIVDSNSDSEADVGKSERRPTGFNGQCWSEDISPVQRPDFLDLGGPPTPVNNRKPMLHFTAAAHGYELNNLDNIVLDAPNIYQDASQGSSHYLPLNSNLCNEMSSEPISMPVDLNMTYSCDETKFSHKNPAYQSAVIQGNSGSGACSSSEGHKDDGHGLKKWKGVTLSPNNDRKAIEKESINKENDRPEKYHEKSSTVENKRTVQEINSDPIIITVEMNRGWNSRLGFSIQPHSRSGHSYISAIYDDSVAARDGRLQQGDIILQVNDENVTTMKTSDIIDLLRILRGSICITVLRPNKL